MSDTSDLPAELDPDDERFRPLGPLEPDPIEPETIYPVDPNFVKEGDDEDLLDDDR